MENTDLQCLDREREILKKAAQRWGFSDERTLKQSELVDRLIIMYMVRSTD